MGFFDFIKRVGQKIGDGIVNVGKKVGGAVMVGTKILGKGLDYGIQGLKIASDFADKYTLGLDHFIPYYSMIKAGIDVADDVRKIAKGEKDLNWRSVAGIGWNVGLGLISKFSAPYEIRALKGASRTFRSARTAGMGIKEASSLGARTLGRAYIPSVKDIKSGFNLVRAGGQLVKGSVAEKNLVGVAGSVARGADKLGDAVKGAVRAVKTGVKSTETFNQPSGSLANLIQ